MNPITQQLRWQQKHGIYQETRGILKKSRTYPANIHYALNLSNESRSIPPQLSLLRNSVQYRTNDLENGAPYRVPDDPPNRAYNPLEKTIRKLMKVLGQFQRAEIQVGHAPRESMSLEEALAKYRHGRIHCIRQKELPEISKEIIFESNHILTSKDGTLEVKWSLPEYDYPISEIEEILSLFAEIPCFH